MFLLDTNVLVHGYREDTDEHDRYLGWLDDLTSADAPFALTDVVLSGFLRIVTHPRVFAEPSRLNDALDFVDILRNAPGAVLLSPGARHWTIFTTLCQRIKARGNVIPDAYLAAIAIEWGCELVSADRGFVQFPGLRWREPLEEP